MTYVVEIRSNAQGYPDAWVVSYVTSIREAGVSEATRLARMYRQVRMRQRVKTRLMTKVMYRDGVRGFKRGW